MDPTHRRGKDKNRTEFGAKINVSEVNGFCRIDRFNWDAYNESADLEIQAENFKKVYGCNHKVLLGDKIYLTRKNRKYLKEKGIEIYEKPLGRPLKSPTEIISKIPEKEKIRPTKSHRRKVRASQKKLLSQHHYSINLSSIII
jgi:hypothetical protein